MEKFPTRKPNRLKGYDYDENGAYFLTVCVKDRAELLGRITVGDAALGVPRVTDAAALGVPRVELSPTGEIVKRYIENIRDGKTKRVVVTEYVIMPNHVHMIALVEREEIIEVPSGSEETANGTPRAASPTKAIIPKMINALKGLTSKEAGFSLWQRSYYDHVIRNEKDYNRIAEYIENNPARWDEDRFNPAVVSRKGSEVKP
jgi:REP element-mobilizing transposase RayT